MNCPDCSEKLHDLVDGELTRADAADVEAHLATCAACRGSLESLRALRAATADLEKEIVPRRDLWAEIAPRLEGARPGSGSVLSFGARPGALGSSRPAVRWLVPWAVAASIAWFFTLAERQPRTLPGPAWNVASVTGAPRVNTRTFQGTGRLHVGQWLETDPASRARVEVGSIGEVNVEPNSRLRLVDASATDHRLELARGELRALIWAPPRLFFVNTPSATAVDLGCAYTLKVDDRGNGELRVTSGYVALEHEGRESIIPNGQMCLTRRGAGPGTPFAADAPLPLQRALERFDFGIRGGGQSGALAEILGQARAADYVMLWHLLSRAQPALRGNVFDALAKIHPAPAGVTRAGIVAGDAAMRLAWADDLGLKSFAAKATVP